MRAKCLFTFNFSIGKMDLGSLRDRVELQLSVGSVYALFSFLIIHIIFHGMVIFK